MFEGWLALTGVELGLFVLKQVVNAGKPVLEGYVQDFFRDCLDGGVARLKASSLKGPMAAAVGCFVEQFVEELRFYGVPDPSIDHYYKDALKQYVRDSQVARILGRAFETDCRNIDHGELEHIWTQEYQKPGYAFPEEFDWAGIAKNYVKAVKGIVRADEELRSLLESDLLKQIADNTAQLSPGFDVETYRASLQSSYGYLKLYTLDSTDSMDQIRLWRMFIEQTVREALPPTRYDIPLDLKRKLQEQGQLEGDLSAEALEHYRRDYLQQPARKVLEAIAEAQQAVILGDPGAGKSTLLQYLALEWVEGKTETLPLLIELREYALAESKNFLEFLHCGRGADWQFDQQQLHQHLLETPTLVMFDGLDEVFHRPTQATVVDEIIRFAQQYPLAKVLVTSRIIGYNPERFQHAGFTQFTIQSLDDGEIEAFIERWYDLAMGSDGDKVRLKRRLRDAIANSRAIRNLADNTLLLTMMAILNRRQELPRDRADLYDQASRVLLYHWDVDHKRLQLPMDAIGRREKQEMLRLIAYEMQAGDEGLKGNLISAERLTQVLTTYLREQGFERAREKANGLIKQLRERNFILCYRGADTYGFVHRTFLEYFCALEIVHRFEKQRSLSFEALRDEVFGGHWQDETWHEVLRLIAGIIDARFAAELIAWLMVQNVNQVEYLDDSDRLRKEGLIHLLLAADCLGEVVEQASIISIARQLLQRLQEEIEREYPYWLDEDAAKAMVNAVALNWRDDRQILPWLEGCINFDSQSYIPEASVSALAAVGSSRLGTVTKLKDYTQTHGSSYVRGTAVAALARGWKDDPDTLPILKTRAQEDDDNDVRQASVAALARGWKDDPELFDCFYAIATTDPFEREHSFQDNPRQLALNALLKNYSSNRKTVELLRDRATNDPDEQLRNWAKQQLKRYEHCTRR